MHKINVACVCVSHCLRRDAAMPRAGRARVSGPRQLTDGLRTVSRNCELHILVTIRDLYRRAARADIKRYIRHLRTSI
jgi:hypothetical protein